MDWTNLGKDPGLPRQPFWTIGKIVSGLVVLLYVVTGAVLLSAADAFEIALTSLVPILCIWTPEILADYKGLGVLHGRPIMRASPAVLVSFLGWITLLLPLLQIAIIVRGVN